MFNLLVHTEPAVTKLGVAPSSLREEISQFQVDIYQFIQDVGLSSFHWLEFEAVLERHWTKGVAKGTADIDFLPLAACLAAGGNVTQSMPVAASWMLYILAGRLFDDLSDQEGGQRDLFSGTEAPTPVSACLFAVAAANAVLSHLDNAETYRQVSVAFNHSLALAIKSEYVRPTLAELSTEAYFETIAAKTGMVFALGTWAGARSGVTNTDPEVLDAFYRYGLHLGMMTQILDDCADLKTDLGSRVWTLPLLYGLSQTAHPLYPQLRESLYQQQEENLDWIEIVVDILTQMKAIPWSLQMVEVHRQQAIAAIKEIPYRQDLLLHYVTSQNK